MTTVKTMFQILFVLENESQNCTKYFNYSFSYLSVHKRFHANFIRKNKFVNNHYLYHQIL